MNRFLNIIITIIFVGIYNIFVVPTFADEYKYHPKEKEFTKAFIKSLPDGFEHKNKYIEECTAKNYSCLPTQGVVYAEFICKSLDSGRPVKDIFENMISFFGHEEGIATVAASIYVICPQHINKLQK
jgi:hypothetical protein